MCSLRSRCCRFTRLPASIDPSLLAPQRPDGAGCEPVRLAAAIALGTLVLYFLFVAILHYDFFPRFERTMAINHNFDFYLRVGLPAPVGPETFGVRLGQIVNAAWINNLDFAAANRISVLYPVRGAGHPPGMRASCGTRSAQAMPF